MLSQLTTTPADEDQELSIRFSIGKNRFDANPKQCEAASFTEFQDKVLTTRAAIKGLFYVAAPFGDGRRSRDSAEPTSFLCFDFDGIPSSEAFADLCMYLGAYRGFGYTTASHTPDAPRARAILAADRPMSRDERMRLSAYVEQLIAMKVPGIKFDASVYRPEQPCFTPVFDSQTFSWDGEPVAVDALLAFAPKLKADGPTASENLAVLSSADPVLVSLRDQGMIKRDLGGGKFAIHCPCANDHSGPSPSETTTTYSLPHTNGFVTGNFSCLHAHCADRPQTEFIEALGLNAKQAKIEQTKVPDVDHSALIQKAQQKIELEQHAETERNKLPGYSPWALTGEFKTSDYLIKGVLNKGELSITFGDSGTMKSFVELDKAMRLGMGWDWNGHKVKRAATLIVLGEGAGGYKKRMRAWLQHHDLLDSPDKPWVWVVDKAAELYTNPAQLQAWVQQASDMLSNKIEHVLIDTLNTNMGAGADENDANAIGTMLAFAQEATDGAAVSFVHHVGHGDKTRERGSYAIRGNMDNRMLVERDEDGHGKIITISSLKVKDGEEFKPVNMTWESVELGRDQDGDPITSLVVTPTDREPLKPKVTKNSGKIQAAILAAGSNSREAVRVKYYEMHSGTEDAKRKAFARDWARFMNETCNPSGT